MYMDNKKICPLMGKSCNTDCAWFVEGDCAITMLSYIVDSLDSVQEAVNALEETIDKMDFS